MKILNLYETPYFDARPAAPVVAGKMTDKQFLEKEIAAWLRSPVRAMQIAGDAYYDGEQDIKDRKRTAIGSDGKLTEVDNLPNNRICDNQYAKMIDQKANYLCGKPITFDTKSSEFADALGAVFDRRRQRLIRIVAEMALKGGVAWICPYYNERGELAFAAFPAHEILPFWADAEHTELDCAVHYFSVWEYKDNGERDLVHKVEVFHGGGIERFIWDGGVLLPDNDADSGPYVKLTDLKGAVKAYNWDKIPLVCFKYNHRERPLLSRVKGLQDALNVMISNFANNMEEDARNTILVIHNYDGENLGEFRTNLATYGAVKVRSFEGSDGGVDTLQIMVNADNYKVIIDQLKKSIIENARGYDAKDERLSGSPNQMNIQSMYSDIDLDANGMETEFQAAFEDLLWFIRMDLANRGLGNFENESVNVIFNRDVMINESEAIDNCGKSAGMISDESILKQHPWVIDPEEEMRRLKEEKKAAAESAQEYQDIFASHKHDDGEEDPDDDEEE